MATKCRKCNTEHDGKFCPECGTEVKAEGPRRFKTQDELDEYVDERVKNAIKKQQEEDGVDLFGE